MAPVDGYVVGVHGAWGSGKSSLLRFIEHYVTETTDTESPVLVEFNPWWFTGQEQLLTRFFDQFLASIKQQGDGVIKKVLPKIGALANLVSEMPGTYGLLGKLLSALFGRPRNDVHELKEQIKSELAGSERKILVFIDDIDRLADEEIRQLFVVIRAIADFPNVIYVVAFDRQAVIGALNASSGGRGEEFLEKIIQLPVELPPLEASQLLDMLTGRVEMVFTSQPAEDLMEAGRWRTLAQEGLSKLIGTPRDVMRLLNAIAVSHVPVEGEVNIVDLFGIESVRLFLPDLYSLVKGDRDAFAGDFTVLDRADRLESLRAFHNSWLESEEEPNRSAAKAISMLLFPKLEAAFSNRFSPDSRLGGWHRQRRICHPAIFSTYFDLAVPTATPSRSEMLALVNLSVAPEDLAARLCMLGHERDENDSSRIDSFLRYLPEYLTGVSEEQLSNVLKGLLRAGRTVVQESVPRSSLASFPIYVEIAHTAEAVLERVSRRRRHDTLLGAIDEANGLAVLVDLIYLLKKGESKSVGGNILESDEIAKVQSVVLERIRKSSRCGTLSSEPDLALLLQAWADWAVEREVRDWVSSLIQCHEGLMSFVAAFMGSGVISDPERSLDKVLRYADPHQLLRQIVSLDDRRAWSAEEQAALNPLVKALGAQHEDNPAVDTEGSSAVEEGDS